MSILGWLCSEWSQNWHKWLDSMLHFLEEVLSAAFLLFIRASVFVHWRGFTNCLALLMRWFLFNILFEQKPLFLVVRRCQSSVWGFNVVNDALWRKNFNRTSSQQSNWYMLLYWLPDLYPLRYWRVIVWTSYDVEIQNDLANIEIPNPLLWKYNEF